MLNVHRKTRIIWPARLSWGKTLIGVKSSKIEYIYMQKGSPKMGKKNHAAPAL
jgi:hypothetical protein